MWITHKDVFKEKDKKLLGPSWGAAYAGRRARR